MVRDDEQAWPAGDDRTDAVDARMAALREALAAERGRLSGGRGSFAPPVGQGPLGGEPPVGGGEGRWPPGEAVEGGSGQDPPGPLVALGVLAAVVPAAAKAFLDPLDEACRAFDITTALRIAHFLAQTAHESALYTALVENLNYGAAGLMATWPSRFDAERAQAYARQPERIANYVYANRMGNGPEESGDGWRFRGRGILQVTGRATYRDLGEFLGLDLEAEPDRLAEPRTAALAAGWYWHAHGINELCDRDDAVAVTEAVNGGRHGLEERLRLLGLAKAALGGPDVHA